jgi:hypothetical protein
MATMPKHRTMDRPEPVTNAKQMGKMAGRSAEYPWSSNSLSFSRSADLISGGDRREIDGRFHALCAPA